MEVGVSTGDFWVRVAQSGLGSAPSVTKPAGMCTGERCNKLLTEHAKSIIQKAIADGEYNDWAEATEPPDMAPSPDASHYSPVRAVVHSLSEPSTQQSLGASGHLPGGYIVSSL